jgi:hypothetical protein
MVDDIVVLRKFAEYLTVVSPELAIRFEPGVSDRELSEFERRLGAPIPRALREYWCLMGRYPPAGVFDGDLEALFSNAQELLEEWSEYRIDGKIPLFFASNSMQTELYCVFPCDGDDPPVYLTGEGVNPMLLYASFSCALLCSAFAVLEINRCSLRKFAFLNETASSSQFDEIVNRYVSGGFDLVVEGRPREVCLRGGGVSLNVQHIFDGRVFLRVGAVSQSVWDLAARENGWLALGWKDYRPSHA